MREVPVETVGEYACEDADCTWRLRGVLEPELGPARRRPRLPRGRDAAPAGARPDGADRHPRRPRGPRAPRGRSRSHARRSARGGDPRGGRGGVQPPQQPEDRRDPLRPPEAPRGRGPQEAPAHREGHGLLDRREDAGGAEGRPSAPRPAPRLARADEARQHLRRAAPDLRQPAHRPRPHDVPPDGRRDRAAVLERPEPPEHPRAQRGGPRHPRGLRARGGLEDGLGRLQPDRAAAARPPRRRPGPPGGVSRRGRRPPRDGREDLRPRAVGGDARDARAREGDQLRHHLRHGPAAARRRDGRHAGRGRALHRGVLPGLPARAGVRGPRSSRRHASAAT